MRTAIIFLFLVSVMFAADPTYETNTVKQTGGTYSSLTTWENGEDDTGDLVASNVISVCAIDGAWSVDDYPGCTINGWTTDATRYILIFLL